MNYDEAAKLVRAGKPKENFLLVRLSYDNHLLMPHSDGMAFIAALGRAEKLVDRYNEPKRIVELDRDTLIVTSMSYREYERYKIAALLNCTPEEVAKYAEVGQPIPLPTPAS